MSTAPCALPQSYADLQKWLISAFCASTESASWGLTFGTSRPVSTAVPPGSLPDFVPVSYNLRRDDGIWSICVTEDGTVTLYCRGLPAPKPEDERGPCLAAGR